MTVPVRIGLDFLGTSRIEGLPASESTGQPVVHQQLTDLSTVYQPLDSDLTAIAALTTTTFGRGFLTLGAAAAGRTKLSLGTAAVQDTGTSGATVPLLDANLTWSGNHTFDNTGSSSANAVKWRRTTADNESLALYLTDTGTVFYATQDESSGQIYFLVHNLDTESGGGAAANLSEFRFRGASSGPSIMVDGTSIWTGGAFRSSNSYSLVSSSYGASGDTDTGLSFPASNTWNLHAGGVEGIRGSTTEVSMAVPLNLNANAISGVTSFSMTGAFLLEDSGAFDFSLRSLTNTDVGITVEDASTAWTFGLDNSDSNAFVVSRSAGLGTNNAMRLVSGSSQFGDSTTNENIEIKAGSGGRARVVFEEAGFDRWTIGKGAPTPDFQIIAQDSAGSVIDVPITVANASGGNITFARPLAMSSNKITGLAAGVDPNDAVKMSQLSGAGAISLISEVVTTGSQASVTFSSIAATYRDLEIRVRGRCSAAGVAVVELRIRFNGDTGSNYDSEDAHWFAGGAGIGQTLGATSGFIGQIPAATAATSRVIGADVVIYDYRGTAFQKEWSGLFGATLGTGGFNVGVGLYSGNWRSTAAINALTVFPASGAFVDGSVVSLYGRM